MAQIKNGQAGPTTLTVRIDVQRAEPRRGVIAREAVAMNSDMGLVWAEVSFWVGETQIFAQEVLLHSLSIRGWADEIEALFHGRAHVEKQTHYGLERVVHFDIASPELLIQVHQLVYTPEKRRAAYGIAPDVRDRDTLAKALAKHMPKDVARREAETLDVPSYHYEMLIIVDTAIAAGGSGPTGVGPAMYLEPDGDDILRFARDLRAEAEIGLLLGEW